MCHLKVLTVTLMREECIRWATLKSSRTLKTAAGQCFGRVSFSPWYLAALLLLAAGCIRPNMDIGPSSFLIW